MIQKMEAILRSLSIEYVVIGGVATSMQGKPRMTMDTDVVLILEKDRIEPLIQQMKEGGFSVTVNSKPKIISRLRGGLPIKLRHKKNFSVDLRIASYTLDKNAIRRARKYLLFDVKLPIASVEDLIVYKLARFDSVDQSDIESLIIRHRNKIDKIYLVETTNKLIEETDNKEIQKHLAMILSWLKEKS